jgi:RNA polymerase sigma factor (TIGR02999 family)
MAHRFFGWFPKGHVEESMVAPSTQQVTKLLQAWGRGQDAALDELLPIVHQELRRLARRHMFGERAGHTLQTTALVNEAYLRLVNSKNVRWQDRAHFFAISSQLMRRILVDSARAYRSKKRGADVSKVTLDEALVGPQEKSWDLIALDDALTVLAEVDPRKSQVVELRFFGGLSVEETAEILKVSPDTVLRDWKMAKAWLKRQISKRESDQANGGETTAGTTR